MGWLAVLALGRTPAWRRLLLQGGSAAGGALALVWMLERSTAWWA